MREGKKDEAESIKLKVQEINDELVENKKLEVEGGYEFALLDQFTKIILDDELEPIANNVYAIRMWVDKDTSLPAGSNFHYHGKIKIIEEDSLLSINR